MSRNTTMCQKQLKRQKLNWWVSYKLQASLLKICCISKWFLALCQSSISACYLTEASNLNSFSSNQRLVGLIARGHNSHSARTQNDNDSVLEILSASAQWKHQKVLTGSLGAKMRLSDNSHQSRATVRTWIGELGL